MNVELRLHVRLARSRADRGGLALDAQQEADRLGEDRLARARLAAEHVEPGGQLELGLANEDEVLDPEAS